MERNIGVVQTKFGPVSGVEENGITIFRGIPYAAPPVGDLRWAPPADPQPWKEVRVCGKFGDMCLQLAGFVGMDAFANHPQSEDCLYLNIWTPARSSSEKLPVLFWIHGGGYCGGLGDEELYHGLSLVAKDVVLVTINYRLGVFGFLAHPELSKESPYCISGNHGVLDQIKALRWVKENIAAFGGDPNRITLDGQSAGGGSVCTLLTTSLTSGLYSGAIIQSGGPHPGRETTLEEAEENGVLLQKHLGCSSLEEMRGMDAKALMKASEKYGYEFQAKVHFGPVVDGVVIKEPAYQAMINGHMGQVPIIIGTNADEGRGFEVQGGDVESFTASAQKYFGKDYSKFCQLYPGLEDNFDRVTLDLYRDFGFVHVRNALEKIQKNLPCQVYQYFFAEPIETEDGKYIGAIHSAELFYVFGTLHCLGGSTIDGVSWVPVMNVKKYQLSDKIGSYWTNFVKSGNPNGPGLPAWEPIDPDDPQALYLTSEIVKSTYSPTPERIAFLTEQLEKHP